MLAAHYRAMYLKEIRMAKLNRDIQSGITYVLARADTLKTEKTALDLFGDETDSVLIGKRNWGIFEMATVKSFLFSDTLKCSFLMGIENRKDSLSLYLSDEDRPLSVIGNTRIMGNVKVPKTGMRISYVDNRPYTGEKMVYGRIMDSKKTLGGLEKKWVNEIDKKLDSNLTAFPKLGIEKQHVSFFSPAKSYNASGVKILSNHLSGQIILYSDTAIAVSATAKLDNVIIYAQSIKIEKGFKGNCQLFARDSIVVENNAVLEYPSVLALVSKEKMVDQAKITLGNNVRFQGIILTYEPKRSALQTMVSLGEKTVVSGEIYVTGLVKLAKNVIVEGKVSCNRFIMQTPATLYENFLIDVILNRKRRSRFYLTSGIFTGEKGRKKVLKWGEGF